MTRRIRVLVVEDSQTIRSRLVEVLAADPELEVVGEAADGPQAIALCERLRPDVMTLDMVLRSTSGLQVTERVMGFCPTPILIVSASLNRGEAFDTFAALAAGAVDVLDKPSGDEAPDAPWEATFIAAVKRVSRIRVITHLRGRLSAATRSRPPPHPASAPPDQAGSHAASLRLVALGASTGGPGALAHILQALPASFPLPLLLVVHIGAPFGALFADWLGQRSELHVRQAVDGERLPAVGQAAVLLAPPDQHLVLRGGRLHRSAAPERHSCRPSVDVLFESVAEDLGAAAIGCLLTGMGRDGAAGLLALRRAGGHTVVQDEASSVVFGMPRAAIALGAAERVLPLDRIAPALMALAGAR